MSDIKTGTFQVNGLADLEKKLMAFPDRLSLNIVKGAVRSAAVVVQKEARLRAHVSKKPHLLVSKASKGMKAKGQSYTGTWVTPGNLRKSIRVRPAPLKKRSLKTEYWVYVGGKHSWYWKFEELGTSKHSPHPFLRPAFDTMKEQATEAMREYLAARIDREAAKL